MGPRTPLSQELVFCPHLCQGPCRPGVLPAQPGSLPAVRRGAGLPALGCRAGPGRPAQPLGRLVRHGSTCLVCRVCVAECVLDLGTAGKPSKASSLSLWTLTDM